VLFDFFLWEPECLQAQQKMEAGAMKSDHYRRFFMLQVVASFFLSITIANLGLFWQTCKCMDKFPALKTKLLMVLVKIISGDALIS
jgi:steroid 5-alpha reductase family enzyme